MKLFPLLLLIGLASCSNPYKSKGALQFEVKPLKTDPYVQNEHSRQDQQAAEAETLRLFKIEKEATWKSIESRANLGFEEIRPLLQKKCFACHDTNTKTPIYARVLTRYNPFYKHQQDGIKALDFSNKFPLLAQGSPSQVALLKAIKNEVLDRTMPIKAYTSFYPKRKINQTDEDLILGWVDPLIKEIEDFEAKYERPASSVQAQMKTIFEAKCFRCHANGNNRGGFENMQDMPALIKSRYVSLQTPLQSQIYLLSVEQRMPPNKRDALTEDELSVFNEWLMTL